MNDASRTHPVCTRLADIPAYQTQDGSLIRELMHPDMHGNVAQSLAEASLPVGGVTLLHCHHTSEEIYHFLEGTALMTLGNTTFAVTPGDTVLIPPSTAHCLHNTGTTPLRLLCACAPAYRHEDTALLEPAGCIDTHK